MNKTLPERVAYPGTLAEWKAIGLIILGFVVLAGSFCLCVKCSDVSLWMGFPQYDWRPGLSIFFVGIVGIVTGLAAFIDGIECFYSTEE